jgi:hypothetical protein
VNEEKTSPSIEPQSAEQPLLINGVPGRSEEPLVPTTLGQPGSEGMKEYGGYTGQRISPDGTNPNAPVVNDPKQLEQLNAAAQSMQDQSETAKV